MSNKVKPLDTRLKLIILKNCVLILFSIFLIFAYVIIVTRHVKITRVYGTPCHLAGKILHWNTAAA